jgi:hypothetical protein
MTTTIRAAVAADIPQIYDIWYANEVGDDPTPAPRGIPSVKRCARHSIDWPLLPVNQLISKRFEKSSKCGGRS